MHMLKNTFHKNSNHMSKQFIRIRGLMNGFYNNLVYFQNIYFAYEWVLLLIYFWSNFFQFIALETIWCIENFSTCISTTLLTKFYENIEIKPSI